MYITVGKWILIKQSNIIFITYTFILVHLQRKTTFLLKFLKEPAAIFTCAEHDTGFKAANFSQGQQEVITTSCNTCRGHRSNQNIIPK